MAELADQVENTGVVAEGTIPAPEIDVGLEPPAKEPAAPPEKEPKKLSLRDQINASVEKVRKDETGRLHKPNGTFAPKGDPAVKEATAELTPKAPEATPAIKPVGLPPGWSAETKAFVNALPPEHPLRKDVEKREKEISDGFKQKYDQLTRYQEIEQVLAPVRQTYQQAGIQSDAEAIKNLFMWESRIRQNPAQALAQLARQYGVTLGPTSEPQTQDIPPALKPVVDQFGNITQAVTALQNDLQRRDQEQAAQTLAAFSKDKPHFDQVKVAMGTLMADAAKVGINMTLDDAYQRAIWASPELSKQVIEDRVQKSLAEERTAAVERSKNAHAAAISPSTRAPAASIKTNGQKPGIRGSILAAVSELRERA